ncbi:MAG: hypothetical protein DMF92_02055 [Acidobacteria bacterium]|nr:MAG: hypothetical protein DMF92_02055 [Acidobacteriota bacterium]
MKRVPSRRRREATRSAGLGPTHEQFRAAFVRASVRSGRASRPALQAGRRPLSRLMIFFVIFVRFVPS